MCRLLINLMTYVSRQEAFNHRALLKKKVFLFGGWLHHCMTVDDDVFFHRSTARNLLSCLDSDDVQCVCLS